MFDWIHQHGALLGWLGGLSVATLVAGVVFLPVVIVRMPADYFVAAQPRPGSWRASHPAVRLTLLVLRNVLGAVVLLAGVAMLVLPGQGLLTMLAGSMLVTFPGKRALELWIVRRRAIRRAVDWMRARAHRPPLVVPEDAAGPGT